MKLAGSSGYWYIVDTQNMRAIASVVVAATGKSDERYQVLNLGTEWHTVGSTGTRANGMGLPKSHQAWI